MTARVPEASLRAPVVAWLEAQGYRTWVDPDGGDFLDLVGLRGEEVLLVELKVADWKGVRAQAVVRRALADRVAVALPSASAAARLEASLRGPVAPSVGILQVDGGAVRELRPARPLAPPAEGTDAAEARRAFRELLVRVVAGEVPPGIAWGGGVRRTGRGRSYRLEEFPG